MGRISNSETTFSSCSRIEQMSKYLKNDETRILSVEGSYKNRNEACIAELELKTAV